MTAEDFYLRFDFNPSISGSLLGRGGFSSVYKVYDKVRKRYVAIKRSEVGVFAKFDLEREVKLANEIEHHPNIIRYENVERISDRAGVYDYAILKYYVDGNLDNVISNHTLSDKERKQILTGILKGLAHLHKVPIIHRDLKAANVLMDRDYEGNWVPVIADFGLSRMVDADMSYVLNNSQIAITPNYASPEQYTENDALRPNTDLWAFGVMTYKMMVGRLPFRIDGENSEKDTSNRIRTMVLGGKLPNDIANIQEPYKSIIQKCLVVNPEKRVKRAEELLMLLEEREEVKPAAPFVQTAPNTGFDGKTQIKGKEIKAAFDPPTQVKRPEPEEVISEPRKPKSNKIGKALLWTGLVLLLIGSFYAVITYFSKPSAITEEGHNTVAIDTLPPAPKLEPAPKQVAETKVAAAAVITSKPRKSKVADSGTIMVFTKYHDLRVYIDGVPQNKIAPAGQTSSFKLPVGQGIIFKVEYIEFGITPNAEPLTVRAGQVFERSYTEKLN
ncbi:serine/threonine-protein kinase [Dyadobacter sp. CY343]|uniref:serine/threonine-protein kinase n=1 Tax=Dyadobacter sp. CY343 TaxID=2907299 RepID=UPI001F279396|nr:serine/threonine-protein kinase [Dyadobacter sp. CY343]MCE7059227.1 serine/threonine-protein kinase [Dyadobacter sp. CY343]